MPQNAFGPLGRGAIAGTSTYATENLFTSEASSPSKQAGKNILTGSDVLPLHAAERIQTISSELAA